MAEADGLQVGSVYVELKAESEQFNKSVERARENLEQLNSAMQKLSEEESKMKKLLDEAGEVYGKNSKRYKVYVAEVMKLKQTAFEVEETIEKISNALSTDENQLNIDVYTAKEKLEGLKGYLDEMSEDSRDIAGIEQLNTLIDRALEENLYDIFKDMERDAKKAFETISELTESLNQISSDLAGIQNIKDDIQELGEVSESSLKVLLDRFPYLARYIDNTEVLLRELSVEEKRLNEENDVNYREMIKLKFAEEESFYNRVIESNADLVNELNTQYGIDLKNFKTLAEAKAAIAEQSTTFYDVTQNPSKIHDLIGNITSRKKTDAKLDELFGESIVEKPQQTKSNGSGSINKVSSAFGRKSSGSVKSAVDTAKAEVGKLESVLKWRLDMGMITEEEYYRSITEIRDKYFAQDTEEWRKHTLNIKKYQDKTAKGQYQSNYEKHTEYISEHNFYNDWGTDSAVSAWQRTRQFVEQSFESGVIALEEYEKKIRDINRSIYAEEENAWKTVVDEFDKGLSFSKSWIEDRRFYDDWSDFGDTEAEAIGRVREKVNKAYEESLHDKEWYLSELRQLDRQLYSIMKSDAEKAADDAIKQIKSQYDSAKASMDNEISDLKEKWSVEDRAADLSELYKQEKIFRNAVTVRGQEKYKDIESQIKRLEREEQLYQLERNKDATITRWESEYRNIEGQRNNLINEFMQMQKDGRYEVTQELSDLNSFINGYDMTAVVNGILETLKSQVTSNVNYNYNTVNNSMSQSNTISDMRIAERLLDMNFGLLLRR